MTAPGATLSTGTLDRLRECWAKHLGIPAAELFASPLQVVSHGQELADYQGALGFFREGCTLVSLPPRRFAELRGRVPGPPLDEGAFAEAFRAVSPVIIGPAFLGYAEVIPPPVHPVQPLAEGVAPLIEGLRCACPPREWEQGGSAASHRGLCGVLIGGKLAALAGYQVWGRVIAHVSVICHPEGRRRGLGRSVVAHAAAHALDAGLIPQYRTLESNTPSRRLADALGFGLYARSVTARL